MIELILLQDILIHEFYNNINNTLIIILSYSYIVVNYKV
jgi:hypothetical protein